MAIVFALPNLYDRVVARFAAEGTSVPMVFGWLAPNTQITTTTRIAWTPGDPAGNVGALGAPKYTGQKPNRQLGTLEELCTIEIYASDHPRTDERKQYQVARELFDALYRAIYLEAVGTFRIVSLAWVGGDRAMRSGATLRLVLAVQAPLFDEALEHESLALDAANIDAAELDHTESVEVPAPPPSP